MVRADPFCPLCSLLLRSGVTGVGPVLKNTIASGASGGVKAPVALNRSAALEKSRLCQWPLKRHSRCVPGLGARHAGARVRTVTEANAELAAAGLILIERHFDAARKQHDAVLSGYPLMTCGMPIWRCF
jgi:hypothetical protein